MLDVVTGTLDPLEGAEVEVTAELELLVEVGKAIELPEEAAAETDVLPSSPALVEELESTEDDDTEVLVADLVATLVDSSAAVVDDRDEVGLDDPLLGDSSLIVVDTSSVVVVFARAFVVVVDEWAVVVALLVELEEVVELTRSGKGASQFERPDDHA